jgi:hypothetical protein
VTALPGRFRRARWLGRGPGSLGHAAHRELLRRFDDTSPSVAIVAFDSQKRTEADKGAGESSPPAKESAHEANVTRSNGDRVPFVICRGGRVRRRDDADHRLLDGEYVLPDDAGRQVPNGCKRDVRERKLAMQ